MLPSMPPIVPRDTFTLWSPIGSGVADEHATPSQSLNADASNQQQQQSQRRNHAGQNKNTWHARLKAEEDALRQRNLNVTRFGATWLRPPGVTKTLQAMMDEEQERVEALMLAQREAERREMEAAAEEDARAAGELPDGDQNQPGQDDMEGMERDLDDDVPDAEDQEGMDMDDGDEDAFVNNEDDEGFAEEHDLDDDVPEAGSYQHTDTEVEDLSSDDDQSSPRHPEQEAEEHITPGSAPNAAAWSGTGPQVIQNFQVPLPMPPPTSSNIFSTPSEPTADSSMVMSSPIGARPAPRGPQPSTPSGSGRRFPRYASRRGENRAHPD